MDIKLAGLVAAVAAGAAGCRSVECGANTIEQSDVCVAQAVDPGAECGPGTVFNVETGRCENALFLDGGGLCGQNTTLVINDAGIRTCVGTGGSSNDCSQALPCPGPSGGNVSLCGRIFDLETSQPLDDGNATNGEPSKKIELRVYDPIAFVAGNAPVLAMAAPDSCGRFAIMNAPLPGSLFIAVATDDVTGSGSDDYVLTGIAAPVSGGVTLPDLRAWVFRRTTDTKWSTQAGLAAGATFGKMGVYIPIFLSGTTPLAPFPLTPTPDVMVAIVGSSGTRVVHPENDFYFDDSDPLARTLLSTTRAQTGMNGTALYINQPSITNFSGIGNAGAGLCWRKDLAAAPVGGAYVQERNPGAQYCP